MFIAYAVPVGVLAGLLLGGRLAGLGRVRFRGAGVAVAALAVQVVLFSGAVDGLVEEWEPLGPLVYVASTVAVLAVVLLNLAIPGLALVAAGAVSNLAAIVANGGYMPADPEALAAAGLAETAGRFSNSTVTSDPALRPLTDIYAIPAALPMSNVFSVGDVLIGLGVAVTIALAMRRGRIAGEAPEDTTVRLGNSPE